MAGTTKNRTYGHGAAACGWCAGSCTAAAQRVHDKQINSNSSVLDFVSVDIVNRLLHPTDPAEETRLHDAGHCCCVRQKCIIEQPPPRVTTFSRNGLWLFKGWRVVLESSDYVPHRTLFAAVTVSTRALGGLTIRGKGGKEQKQE